MEVHFHAAPLSLGIGRLSSTYTSEHEYYYLQVYYLPLSCFVFFFALLLGVLFILIFLSSLNSFSKFSTCNSEMKMKR